MSSIPRHSAERDLARLGSEELPPQSPPRPLVTRRYPLPLYGEVAARRRPADPDTGTEEATTGTPVEPGEAMGPAGSTSPGRRLRLRLKSLRRSELRLSLRQGTA
jgi:hypothetical protein